MQTNQLTPEVNQLWSNDETILRTLDNTELESLSGGGIDAYLRLDGVDGESAESSSPLNIEIKVTHNV